MGLPDGPTHLDALFTTSERGEYRTINGGSSTDQSCPVASATQWLGKRINVRQIPLPVFDDQTSQETRDVTKLIYYSLAIPNISVEVVDPTEPSSLDARLLSTTLELSVSA